MESERTIASTAQRSFTAPDEDVLPDNSDNDSGEGSIAWAQGALKRQARSRASGQVHGFHEDESDRSELATSVFSESLYGRPLSFWGSAISVALERADVPQGLKLEPGWKTWKFYRDEYIHEFKQLGPLLDDFGCGPGPSVIMHREEIRSFADPKQIIIANVIFRRLTDTNKALRVMTEWMQTLSVGPLRTFAEGEVT